MFTEKLKKINRFLDVWALFFYLQRFIMKLIKNKSLIKTLCTVLLSSVYACSSSPETAVDTVEYDNNVSDGSIADDVWRDPKGNAYLIEAGHAGDIYINDNDRHEFGGGHISSQNRLIVKKQLQQCYEECQFVMQDVIDVVNNDNEVLMTLYPDKINVQKYEEDYFMFIRQIEVQSSKFRTKEGVGIGTSYHTFMNKYADHTEVSCIKDGLCSLIVKNRNLDNVHFYFDYKTSTRIYSNITLDKTSKSKPMFRHYGATGNDSKIIEEDIEVSNILIN